MKIQLVSDLHMEFGSVPVITNAGADLLILSGDIIVAERFKRSEDSPFHAQTRSWLEWFEQTCNNFGHVIYVLGNHEHYHGRFNETYDRLVTALSYIQNLSILDNTWLDYDGIRFFGTTLWTSFDNDNFKAMIARDGMNDYKCIEGSNYRKLKPVETMMYHQNALRSIVEQASTGRDMVVVGHHLPSYRSIHQEYAGSPLNAAYASHLDRVIESFPNIRLWTHGHTHKSADYHIGKTRIVANPRGYPLRSGACENEAFNPDLVISI